MVNQTCWMFIGFSSEIDDCRSQDNDMEVSWNRATPSHHPFRTMGFSRSQKPSSYLGYMAMESPILGGELPTNRLGGLVHPSYKWTTCPHKNPIYNQGELTHLRSVGSSPPSIPRGDESPRFVGEKWVPNGWIIS